MPETTNVIYEALLTVASEHGLQVAAHTALGVTGGASVTKGKVQAYIFPDGDTYTVEVWRPAADDAAVRQGITDLPTAVKLAVDCALDVRTRTRVYP